MTSGWWDSDGGRRELDWDVLFGDIDDADYLTPLGRHTARRAMDGLSEFFGSGWLQRAAEKTPKDRIALTRFRE